jgi:broad specificity phosphatase PhoE
MALLYLIRHGETIWNREGRFQGQEDVPLSPEGERQGEQVVGRLQGEGLTLVVASDLARARVTAQALAEAARVPLQLDPRLREMHFGAWQGWTRRDMEERDPEAFRAYLADPWRGRPTGGESFADVLERVGRSLQEWVERHPQGRLAVVAHGGTIRAALCHYLGWDPRRRGLFRLDNAGLTLLEVRPDGFVSLHVLNDTCHLDRRPARPGRSQGGDAF